MVLQSNYTSFDTPRFRKLSAPDKPLPVLRLVR